MSRPAPGGALQAAEAYLDSLVNHERRADWPYARLGLEPIRALLARLGHPERELSVVHIAGSKGKGSTALWVEAILSAAGERVGTFTSPHLARWTERFRVGGRELDGDALAAVVARVRPHVDALRRARPDDAPTFFDATTAVAIASFAEAAVDRAILEVGLGGRLDSTNAVTPAVTCITGIELEHTDKLGSTLAEIAREKAGILKPGLPLVLGPVAPEVRAVIRARAAELDAPVAELGRDFRVEIRDRSLDGMEIHWSGADAVVGAMLPVLGRSQAANAALAIAAVRCLRPDWTPDEFAQVVSSGLKNAVLPARAELLRRGPWIVVDAAHTPASARELVDVLAALPFRELHLVLSVSADKDLGTLLETLLPLATEITVTRALAARSLEPRVIAAAIRTQQALRADAALRVVPNPHLAVRAARESLRPEAGLCVTGSVYLAGIARELLTG